MGDARNNPSSIASRAPPAASAAGTGGNAVADDRLKPFRVAVSGASGMIGSSLCRALSVPSLANRHNPHVCRLVRGEVPPGSRDIRYLPDDSYVDLDKLEGCDAVVNLAGEGMGMRLGERSMHRVFHSRRRATELLANGILSLEEPPKVVVSASGIGCVCACVRVCVCACVRACVRCAQRQCENINRHHRRCMGRVLAWVPALVRLTSTL